MGEPFGAVITPRPGSLSLRVTVSLLTPPAGSTLQTRQQAEVASAGNPATLTTSTTSTSEQKVKGRPLGGAAGTFHARFLASGPAPWPLAAWPTRPPPVETRWAGFAQRARGAEPGDSERFEEGDSALAINSQCGRGWTPPSQKPPPLGSFSSASPRPRLALTTVTWQSGVLS